MGVKGLTPRVDLLVTSPCGKEKKQTYQLEDVMLIQTANLLFKFIRIFMTVSREKY